MKNLILASLLVQLAGCAPPESEAAAPTDGGPLVVYTVNYPLEYFAGRIGGDAVRVEFPAPEGDPAFWSPSAETVVAYQTADLILRNGAGYAQWAERASLPASRAVDTSAGFADRLIAQGGITHGHGPDGEHEHGSTAFTTWLDPTLAIEQARAVLAAFERARPEEAEGFRRRLEALEGDLRSLDERLAAIVAADPTRPLVGSHPVYQYLARRFALNLVSVHWEPDEAPDDGQWRAFEQLLEGHPARWMLWEGTPMDETRARLEKLGVESVVFDPAGNRPGSGDFLDVMRANAEELARAFR